MAQIDKIPMQILVLSHADRHDFLKAKITTMTSVTMT